MKIFAIFTSVIFLAILPQQILADNLKSQQDKPRQIEPLPDNMNHPVVEMGIFQGVVKECDISGCLIENVEVFIKGQNSPIVVTDRFGRYDVALPAKTYDFIFVHNDYWPMEYENIVISGSDINVRPESHESILTYPDPHIAPSSMEMSFSPGNETHVDGYFDIANYGCGDLEYNIQVVFSDTVNQGDVFSFYPQSGVVIPGEEQEIRIRFNPGNDPGFDLFNTTFFEIFVLLNVPHSSEAYLLVSVVLGSPIPDLVSVNQMPLYDKLHQNSPNPFNPSTTIQFDLKKAQDVTLTVFNLMGQEVARLVDGNLNAGQHSINFDGSHLASGIYFYRIETPEFTDMKKMVIMK